MADTSVVHIGENSPEQVAYKLLHEIAAIENTTGRRDRKWWLDTYAECLLAVRSPSSRVRP